MRLKCDKENCKHEWDYQGKSNSYAYCPKCRKNINLKHLKPENIPNTQIKCIEKNKETDQSVVGPTNVANPKEASPSIEHIEMATNASSTTQKNGW
jgi:hypothetical protein